MVNNYKDLSLTAWMAWLHLAIMAVPLLIFIAKLEWEDWKEAHPRIATERKASPRHAFGSRPHPV